MKFVTYSYTLASIDDLSVVVVIVIVPVEKPPDGSDDKAQHQEEDERVEAAADPDGDARAGREEGERRPPVAAEERAPVAVPAQRRRHWRVDVDVRPAHAPDGRTFWVSRRRKHVTADSVAYRIKVDSC